MGLFTDLIELEYHWMLIALSNVRTCCYNDSLCLGAASFFVLLLIQSKDYHKPIDKTIYLKSFDHESVKVDYKIKQAQVHNNDGDNNNNSS